MTIPTELGAIAEDPLAAEPYLEWATLLEGRGDPRGPLVRLQVAMETAAPVDRVALFQQERALFSAHADALFGPLAGAVRAMLADEPRYGPRVTQARSSAGRWFFRGFITALTRFGDVALERIPAIMRSRELQCCASVSLPEWPRRLPEGIGTVKLRQAAITERLLAEPSLRNLEIDLLVDALPLVHDGLETLRLPGDSATVDALREARLPALRRFVVTDLPSDPEAIAALAAVMQPLRDDVDVEIRFAAPSDVQNITTLEALDALRPIAHRVTALTLTSGHRGDLLDLPWDAELPRLRKVEAGGLTAATLRAPAFRTVRELFLERGTYSFQGESVLSNLLESGVAPNLRSLGLYTDGCAPDNEIKRTVAKLAAAPFDALEVLMLAGSLGTPDEDLFAGLPDTAFPKLRAATVPAMWVRATRAGVRGAQLEIDVPDHMHTFWSSKSLEAPAASPPQFEGLRRATRAPDLRAFPRYADVWRAGMLFEEATEAALLMRGRKNPPALEACEPFLGSLGVTLETKGMYKLDRPAREERIASWRAAADAALRARDGVVAGRLFGLSGLAWRAQLEIFGGSEVGREPVSARRFLDESEDLPEQARAELDEVQAWCRRIVAGRPASRVARKTLTASEYEERVLLSPFSEAALSADAPRAPDPPRFETVSADQVRRTAIWYGVSGIVHGGGDVRFEGDATRGVFAFYSGTGNDGCIAWCPEGIVGFAFDVYAQDDVEEDGPLEMLGDAPPPLRALAEPLLGRVIQAATSALWITRDARHRTPAERIDGLTRGIELLDGFVGEVPSDALVDDLVDRILAGGGVVPEELFQSGGLGGGTGVDAVVTRLESLGLRRA